MALRFDAASRHYTALARAMRHCCVCHQKGSQGLYAPGCLAKIRGWHAYVMRPAPRFPDRRSLCGAAKKVHNQPPHATASSTLRATLTMASAYKSATRMDDESDMDSEDELMSNESSATVEDETSGSDMSGADDEEPAPKTSTLDQLPVELRNRILMLTSRGVSHRSAFHTTTCIIANTSQASTSSQ